MMMNYCVALVALLSCLSAAPARTALEHLQAAPKPQFKPGHTLPPLTRWGWSMPYAVRLELCTNWGYALEFGGYLTPEAVADLDIHTNSDNARLVALSASDPKKYPLAVLTHRPLPNLIKSGLTADELKRLYACDKDGRAIVDTLASTTRTWRTISPEAPASIFLKTAEGTAAPLAALRKKTPIAMVLNGGEYGLSIYGHGGAFWAQDPAVLEAKGDRSWYDYISEAKVRQEQPVADAVRKTVPDRTLYLWYHFAGEPTWGTWNWSWDYKYTRSLTDLPTQSLYYKQFNSGWAGEQDLLSNFLCSVAQAIGHYQHPLSYNWVCGGWITNKFSDRARYTGFLTCVYMAGAVGNVAGYFSHPDGLDGKDVGEEPPQWLFQMMALGRVHATFSHLEEFLRQGDLLPGPGTNRLAAAAGLPAYEFPSGSPGARVLVRRLRGKAEWLVAAWAAEGEAREVTVTLPDIGPVTVKAAPEATLTRVTAALTPYEPPALTLTPIAER
jgi:hypothetical protein